MKMDPRDVDVDLAMKRFLNLPEGKSEAWGEAIDSVQVDMPEIEVIDGDSHHAFQLAEVAEMQYVINQHRPDVLWLGMTAPKQEVLLAQLSQSGTFRFAAGIGAAFDFYVGTVRRSPPVFRRLGLEWLPRLVQEPRRLWRRMFVSAPIFLMDVARDALRLGRFGA